MITKKLMTPLTVGPYELRNRVVMAPLTRTRAGDRNIPREMNIVYYRQRANAGLIISEATSVSPSGYGYYGTPGIHTEEQRDAWKRITDPVHEEGGLIFLQLWHVGRISHQDLQPRGVLPVSASAVQPRGNALTRDGLKPHPSPRALTPGEIDGVVEEYRRGAQLAMEAGFDGVEVHGANGYLPDQFLNSGSNSRTDEWGGSIENRARFLLAVTDAVVDVWGADRVGVRLSPANRHGDIDDANRWETYSYVVRELNKRTLAYLHLVSPRVDGAEDAKTTIDLGPERFRPLITGNTRLVVAGGYKPADAESILNHGIADAVAFGRLFISNPDLPRRIELDAPLNAYDRKTFYAHGVEGYIDYPTLDAASLVQYVDG
jgi:N-ethylmaleimide reductase